MSQPISAFFLLIFFLIIIEDISEANISSGICSPGIKTRICLKEHKPDGKKVIDFFSPLKKYEVLELWSKNIRYDATNSNNKIKRQSSSEYFGSGTRNRKRLVNDNQHKNVKTKSQSEITTEIDIMPNIYPNYNIEIREKHSNINSLNNGKRRINPDHSTVGDIEVELNDKAQTEPGRGKNVNMIAKSEHKFKQIETDKRLVTTLPDSKDSYKSYERDVEDKNKEDSKYFQLNEKFYSMWESLWLSSKGLNHLITSHKNKRSVINKDTGEQEDTSINYVDDTTRNTVVNSIKDNEGRIKNEARQNSRYSGYRGYGYRGNRYRYGSSASNGNRPSNNRPAITITATININHDVPDAVSANNNMVNNIKPQPNARCNPVNHLFYQNPEDCSTYFTCNQGIMVLTHCPRGLYYIPEHFRCEDGIAAGCKLIQYQVIQDKPINEH